LLSDFLEFLRRGPAGGVVVGFDDRVGETRPRNVRGTVTEAR
jgi:hypothetical protein